MLTWPTCKYARAKNRGYVRKLALMHVTFDIWHARRLAESQNRTCMLAAHGMVHLGDFGTGVLAFGKRSDSYRVSRGQVRLAESAQATIQAPKEPCRSLALHAAASATLARDLALFRARVCIARHSSISAPPSLLVLAPSAPRYSSSAFRRLPCELAFRSGIPSCYPSCV